MNGPKSKWNMHAMVLLLLVKIGAVRKWFSTVTSQKEEKLGEKSLIIKDAAVFCLDWRLPLFDIRANFMCNN